MGTFSGFHTFLMTMTDVWSWYGSILPYWSRLWGFEVVLPATRGKMCVWSGGLSILRFLIGRVECWLLGPSTVHIKTVFWKVVNFCVFRICWWLWGNWVIIIIGFEGKKRKLTIFLLVFITNLLCFAAVKYRLSCWLLSCFSCILSGNQSATRLYL